MRDDTRSDFPYLATVPTRWADNDVYGHVNNVTYYSYFDTAVNRFLIEGGVLDIADGTIVGLVVESGCTFFASIAFPDVVEVGVRVSRIGTSSVRYEVAIFKQGEPDVRAAGHYVHVYVDRESGRPTPIPDATRALLETLLVASK